MNHVIGKLFLKILPERYLHLFHVENQIKDEQGCFIFRETIFRDPEKSRYGLFETADAFRSLQNML